MSKLQFILLEIGEIITTMKLICIVSSLTVISSILIILFILFESRSLGAG